MKPLTPRPHQEEILKYTRGTMGISAVPGSGKTWTLSALTARLIKGGFIKDGQEVLIVTLTNSAVDNFTSRINEFLHYEDYRPLIPPYRVRTLHGLAHDIVRERPDLVGLDSSFLIVDEREADQIRSDIVHSWLLSNPDSLSYLIHPEVEEKQMEWLFRDQLPNLLKTISTAFNRTAKDMQFSPKDIQDHLHRLHIPLPLAQMGADLFVDYQRSLAYRGGVDFDDLILFAMQALNTDIELLERLQTKWPYVLEDEAQDSSLLQEKILRLLTEKSANWVRVGDPNQAIYESFTTANPIHLKNFMKECEIPQELPNSGRSTPSIIELANHLIDWTKYEHPIIEIRDGLDKPYIEPTPVGDPQPNPPANPVDIHFVSNKYSPDGELNAITESIARWLPKHQDYTVAVLVPRNIRGFQIADNLRKRNIEVVDSLLQSSSTTRAAAGALVYLLRYLADPANARKLSAVFKVWRRADRKDPEIWNRIEDVSNILETCRRVEDFIWPLPERDWLDTIEIPDDEVIWKDHLYQFREFIRRCQGTVLLPINQIIITLAQVLFKEPVELAIAHKLASLLRQVEKSNRNWRLPELSGELAIIARNERRFLGFSTDDTGFDPENHKGKVVVATLHKAKGLEWDRVYLASVNNYNFPSGMPGDNYYAEKWFIRDNLNLEAETLVQLKIAVSSNNMDWYQEGKATREARLEFSRERLRLFYVGITRAKRELVVTWNSGQKPDSVPLNPSVPFIELQSYWETKTGGCQ